ncbi:MAG: LysR family transcriptional regulator [Xanthobacteraceae bacterium]
MHRRHEGRNIPIELLRTAVAIADLGSYTRAARELGLSQPSVSSHVKRLQRIVAGEIFDLSSGSPRPTDYGEVIIEHARRVLSNNDQLLSVANVRPYNKNQIVLGLHNSIATSVLSGLFAEFVADKRSDVTFRNLGSQFLLKGLEGGYIDIALLMEASRPPPVAVLEWWDPLYWVKGPDFCLDPTKPIPLVSNPASLADQVGIAALRRAGLRYGTVFVSAQMNARLAAVAGNVGIMAIPARSISDGAIVADDSVLPELPQVRSGIYTRAGLELTRVERIISVLESQLRPREQFEIITPAPKRAKLESVKSK